MYAAPALSRRLELWHGAMLPPDTGNMDTPQSLASQPLRGCPCAAARLSAMAARPGQTAMVSCPSPHQGPVLPQHMQAHHHLPPGQHDEQQQNHLHAVGGIETDASQDSIGAGSPQVSITMQVLHA